MRARGRRRLGIRARTTAVVALATALVGLLGLWTLIAVADGQIDAAVDDGLRTRSANVVRSITLGEPILDPQAQRVDPSGRVLAGSPGLSATSLLDGTQLAAALDHPTVIELSGELRVHTTPLDGGVVVVASPLADLENARDRLAVVAAIAMVVLIAAVWAASWFVVGATLSPVRRMTEAAQRLGHEIGPRRLPPPGTGDELDTLATTLNGMLDRIASTVERERAFVDDASHDLRTPLTLIRGELELAQHETEVQAMREGLVRALTAAERLSVLADDLLVLARIDGGQRPRTEPVPLQPWLQATVARLTRLGGATIEAQAPDITSSFDVSMIERALQNLTVNARQAGAHRIRVEATTHHSSRGDELLSLAVADDGPGFPLGLLASAGQRFTRADTARGTGGAGLGLSIADAVARAHGGAMSISNGSAMGGAVVTVTITAAVLLSPDS